MGNLSRIQDSFLQYLSHYVLSSQNYLLFAPQQFQSSYRKFGLFPFRNDLNAHNGRNSLGSSLSYVDKSNWNLKGLARREGKLSFFSIVGIGSRRKFASRFKLNPRPLIYLNGVSLLDQLILQNRKLLCCSDASLGRIVTGALSGNGSKRVGVFHFYELLINKIPSQTGSHHREGGEKNSNASKEDSPSLKSAQFVILSYMDEQWLISYLYFCGGMGMCWLTTRFLFNCRCYIAMNRLNQGPFGRSLGERERLIISFGCFFFAVWLGIQDGINVTGGVVIGTRCSG